MRKAHRGGEAGDDYSASFWRSRFRRQQAGSQGRGLREDSFAARQLFNPFMREVAEMHYLGLNPLQLDDSRLRQAFPDLQKTSQEDGIRMKVEAMKSRSFKMP
jgi:hypothetical protein